MITDLTNWKLKQKVVWIGTYKWMPQNITQYKLYDWFKSNESTVLIFVDLMELLLYCAHARGTTLKPRLYYANKAKHVQYWQ